MSCRCRRYWRMREWAPCPLLSFLTASERDGDSSSSFTANIRNRNTRLANARAVKQFFDWSEERGLGLDDIEPMTVAGYVEQLGAEMAKPSVKQHLAGIRQLFDYL